MREPEPRRRALARPGFARQGRPARQGLAGLAEITKRGDAHGVTAFGGSRGAGVNDEDASFPRGQRSHVTINGRPHRKVKADRRATALPGP